MEKGFDIPFHSWSSNIRDSFSFQGGIAYRIEFCVVGYLAVSQIFGSLIHVGYHVLGHHSSAPVDARMYKGFQQGTTWKMEVGDASAK